MNTALKFIALGISGFAFVSCCGLDNNYSNGSKLVEKKVVKYEDRLITVNPGGKGATPITKVISVPVESTRLVRVKCKTTDRYRPEPDCGGQVSEAVVSRASAQGGTGEPHLGLIPTMRPLDTVE